MMLRLADLYFQEGRDIYMTEMETYEAEFDACFNNPNCDTDGMEPDNGRSKKWQAKSIRLYKRILQQFPNFRRADEATFYLATALQDTGKRPKGIEQFKNLVRSYPDSGFVPVPTCKSEIYSTKTTPIAPCRLQKSRQYRDSEKFGFALYKLPVTTGNGRIRSGHRHDEAGGCSQVRRARPANRTGIQLSEEALKDCSLSPMLETWWCHQYFISSAGRPIRSMLKRLANAYLEQKVRADHSDLPSLDCSGATLRIPPTTKTRSSSLPEDG